MPVIFTSPNPAVSSAAGTPAVRSPKPITATFTPGVRSIVLVTMPGRALPMSAAVTALLVYLQSGQSRSYSCLKAAS
ncbi:MAG: hypothetical protein R2736_05420 [Solirubrobacterales bacterium]